MLKITALIHTCNDAQRIGRALESLRPCDELLVVDEGSSDDTARLAREHGARVVSVADAASAAAMAAHDWLLCLRPTESLTESLEAALFEWKLTHPAARRFAVTVREEHAGAWRLLPPETRLVHRSFVTWNGKMPSTDRSAPLLPGDLMRFQSP